MHVIAPFLCQAPVYVSHVFFSTGIDGRFISDTSSQYNFTSFAYQILELT